MRTCFIVLCSTIMTHGLQEDKTRWAHYKIGYHFVWIPKYRRRILTDEVQTAFKELAARACDSHDITLLEVETDQDHVHLFVSAPPRRSPSWIANILKGCTSRWLRMKFPWLRKKTGKESLWTQTYYVGTVGQVSAETVRRYISECQGS